jgi:hypothetical protein
MYLFLLFINDIADDIQSLVRLFADDSSLIFSSTNPLEVEDRLNLDLQVSCKFWQPSNYPSGFKLKLFQLICIP